MKRIFLIFCCIVLVFSSFVSCKEEDQYCTGLVSYSYENVDILYQAIIDAKQKDFKGETINDEESTLITVTQIPAPIFPQGYVDSIQDHFVSLSKGSRIDYTYDFLYSELDGELEKTHLVFNVYIDWDEERIQNAKQEKLSRDTEPVLTENDMVYDEAMGSIFFQYQDNWVCLSCYPHLPYEELLKFTQFETIEIP